MTHCPSHDWDRHVDELDRAAAEECAFYRDNADRILAVVAAMMINPNVRPASVGADEAAGMVTAAAIIVGAVVGRGAEP